MIPEDFNIEFHYSDGDIGVHQLTDSEGEFTIDSLIKDWENADTRHCRLLHVVIRPKLST